MRERWKSVDGYENLYEVSDHGNVRSFPRLVSRVSWYGLQEFVKPGQLLKPGYCKGYPKVTLTKNGVEKQYWVHRLVAVAFIGAAPFDDAFVLHLDDNPRNANYKNLRWGTAADNSRDMVRKERQCRGHAVSTAVLTVSAVEKIVRLLKRGLSSSVIAEQFSVSRCTINDICAGRSWTHVTGFARTR